MHCQSSPVVTISCSADKISRQGGIADEQQYKEVADIISLIQTSTLSPKGVVFTVPFEKEDGGFEASKAIQEKLPGRSVSNLIDKLRKNQNYKDLLDSAAAKISSEIEEENGVSFHGLRLRTGMTQKELAAAAGLEQYQISKLESGHGLSSPNLIKLRVALGASPDDIFKALEKLKS